MNTELQEIDEKVIPLVEEIESYRAVNAETYEQGGKYLKLLTNLEKIRKGKEDLALIPAKASVEAIRDIYRPAKEKIAEAVEIIKDRMVKYYLAEEQRQEKERAKILADSRTKVETKEAKLSTVVTAPTANTFTVRKLRVLDLKKIPREFFDLNESRLKKWLEDGNSCPGAEVYTEKKIRA